MHYSKIVLAIFAISLLSACAEQQQSNTAYVSPLEFKHYNCKQLSKEMIRTSQMLDKSNDDAALSDVAGRQSPYLRYLKVKAYPLVKTKKQRD